MVQVTSVLSYFIAFRFVCSPVPILFFYVIESSPLGFGLL